MSKKKDEGSWRYGGIKRRDFRHTHDGPEVPRHKGTKKSTKKWCKGKKGVEHIPIRKIEYYTIRGERKEAYRPTECETCGKRLGYEWNKGGDFKFTVGKPYPLNADIVSAVESEQTAAASTNAQAQKNAQIEAKVLGDQKLVDLYGADGALLYKAIESGKVQIMVVPKDGNISIPTPTN